MVLTGDYLVRLVDAETKAPFKEHDGPAGEIYAEVEPGVDYMIEIEVVGGDFHTLHMFEFTVDDMYLGYTTPLYRMNAGSKSYNGIWSRQDGIENMRALSFQRPTFTNSSGDSVRGGLMGTVKVEISEAIYAGTRAPSNFSGTSMTPASVSSDLTHAQTKKVLRSGEGSYCETKMTSSNEAAERYDPGDLLETITINYCTALGLIKAGVLAKPQDVWEEARMANPAKRGSSSNSHAVDVKPKRVKRGAVLVDNGETLQASEENELFDLTADASDDES